MVRDYRLAQKRGAVAAAASLALLFPIAFVQAQNGSANSLETSMPELLSGKTIPLKLQMKDLVGGKWRRVTTIGKSVAAMANASSVLSSAPTYTKGQTVRMDGESFLVLYTLQSLGTKDAITAQVVFGGKPTPDAPLALTLLSLRNVSALESVAEFRLSEETVTQAELDRAVIKIRNDSTDGSLREVGKALTYYSQDHQKSLPAMTSADSLKKSLQLYLRSGLYFASTTSGKPFVTNAILSNKPLTGIANPSHAAVVYESAPAPDETRAAAFADGHVERFAEAQWPSIARASGINTP